MKPLNATVSLSYGTYFLSAVFLYYINSGYIVNAGVFLRFLNALLKVCKG
jgi:hypothetical protein